MTNNKLSPCPFCGSAHAPQIRELPALPSPRYVVVCHNCSARGPGKELPEMAITGWNKTGGTWRQWSKDAYITLRIGEIIMPPALRAGWYDLSPILDNYPGDRHDAGRIDEQGYLQLRCDYEQRVTELEAEITRLRAEMKAYKSNSDYLAMALKIAGAE